MCVCAYGACAYGRGLSDVSTQFIFFLRIRFFENFF